MKCAIMQPTFNPWIGLFDMIDKVDMFVFYNDVQLTKRSWQVRNRILTKNGELFLSIPIKKSQSRDDILINAAQIDYSQKWIDQHLKSFAYNYSKASYFDEVFEFISGIYQQKIAVLGLFNQKMISGISAKIGINTPFITSDSIENITGTKDVRLVNVCKSLGATTYLSAQGSAAYIEAATPGGAFAVNSIDLCYHNYNHPTYDQQSKGDFVPYMGVLDLLFNVGFGQALAIIRSGRQDDYTYLEYRNLHLYE